MRANLGRIIADAACSTQWWLDPTEQHLTTASRTRCSSYFLRLMKTQQEKLWRFTILHGLVRSQQFVPQWLRQARFEIVESSAQVAPVLESVFATSARSLVGTSPKNLHMCIRFCNGEDTLPTQTPRRRVSNLLLNLLGNVSSRSESRSEPSRFWHKEQWPCTKGYAMQWKLLGESEWQYGTQMTVEEILSKRFEHLDCDLDVLIS